MDSSKRSCSSAFSEAIRRWCVGAGHYAAVCGRGFHAQWRDITASSRHWPKARRRDRAVARAARSRAVYRLPEAHRKRMRPRTCSNASIEKSNEQHA